jgi:hypothetical protein
LGSHRDASDRTTSEERRGVLEIHAVELAAEGEVGVENASAPQFIEQGFDLGVLNVEAERGTADFDFGDFQFALGGLGTDGPGNVMDTKRSVVLSELLDLHKDCGLERHGLNLITHICLSIVVIVDVSTLCNQYNTWLQIVKGEFFHELFLYYVVDFQFVWGFP